jgi:ElaB/YqjD/DUF883 family membrane-anchored ribosome-binding protein
MTINEANERLFTDAKHLTHDAEELLSATAGEANDKIKEVRARLAKAVESAKATCENLQGTTVRAAKATDSVIRKHPYESIGIAAGVGLLVGLLVGRR